MTACLFPGLDASTDFGSYFLFQTNQKKETRRFMRRFFIHSVDIRKFQER